jgi:hypothetical protein
VDRSIVIASEYHAKQDVLSFLPLDAEVEIAFFKEVEYLHDKLRPKLVVHTFISSPSTGRL